MHVLDITRGSMCSGGVRSSRIAATHLGSSGKVAVAEHAPLGGYDCIDRVKLFFIPRHFCFSDHVRMCRTCVNVGCVPKKLMVYGAHFLQDVEGEIIEDIAQVSLGVMYLWP